MKTATAAILVLSLSTPALAQTYAGNAPPPAPAPAQNPRIEAPGWNFGFSVGGGVMNFSDCGLADCELVEVGSFSARVGFMLAPRLTLLGEIWGVGTGGTYSTQHGIATIGIRYWITPRFWGQIGIGSGILQQTWDDIVIAETEPTLAAMGAVGFEVFTTPTFAIDIQVRSGASFYEEGNFQNFTVGVGFGWHFWR